MYYLLKVGHKGQVIRILDIFSSEVQARRLTAGTTNTVLTRNPPKEHLDEFWQRYKY